MSRGTAVGLLILGAVPFLGVLLPATTSWGFNHLAYLPTWCYLGFAFAWVALLAPPFRLMVAKVGYDLLGRFLFDGSIFRPLLAVALLTVAFILLRTPTHLLGDGVLVGELAGRGAAFRAHDAMDYLLHVRIHAALGNLGDNEASFKLYTIGSWIAGFLAVMVALLLLRRSTMPIQTKSLIFALWLLAAPTLLFCGYVESYGYVSVAMLGFLWSGSMAQRGDAPPWLPGLLYGFALFFHTTAIFAAPALLWLAFRPGPEDLSRKDWALRVIGPALIGPILAIIIHLAAGYDMDWFRREFLESKNQRSVLIRLTGSHGLFSLTHLKDLANWMLLVIPVTGWLVASRIRTIRQWARTPDIAFQLVQVASFAIVFLLIDRKLGAARDWDLLTPQVAGMAYLAGRLFERESMKTDESGILPSVRVAAPWVALLTVVPWFWVNASTERSLWRFDEIRADFARHPRAYAAEELAKYFRDHEELEKSLVLYEESVEIFPHNARTRILLGSNYLMLDRVDEALEQYDIALEIDPKNWLAHEMKGKVALQAKDFARALPVYRSFSEIKPSSPDAWAGRGLSAYYEGQYQEAFDSFIRAGRLRNDPKLYYYAGLAAGHIDKWDDAIKLLGLAQRADPSDPATLHALAAATEARYSVHLEEGGRPDPNELIRARDLAARAYELSPSNEKIRSYLDRLNVMVGMIDSNQSEER